MNLSSNLTSFAMKHLLNAFANAPLTVYSGVQPATPETVLSGNTVLVPFELAFAPAAFQALGGGFEAYRLAWISVTVTATGSGTATFARFTLLASPPAWGPGNDYFRGEIVTNGGNFYVCLVDGHSLFPSAGPTSTADSIPDNTTAWAYFGPTSGQNNVLMDLTVGLTAPSDLILAAVALTSGVTSVTLPVPIDVQMPAL